MKEQYATPDFETVRFENDDVIMTSGVTTTTTTTSNNEITLPFLPIN